MDSIKIGILGMGNIGGGLYSALYTNKKKIEGYLGKSIEVKKILVRSLEKSRGNNIQKDLLTTSIDDILQDSEIEIAVELIGGLSPAYEYITALLESKKHVVTANKAVIATYGKELEELAQRNGVKLRFEGSVGGGIPIINTLSESLSGNEIDEIVGIINGTTNFILTQMSDKGMDFEEALQLAKAKGYAEADPTSDIEGEDAAFKLSILSSVAFDKRVNPQDIPREGINKVSQKDIQYANQLGYIIKLLALAKRYNDGIELQVHPALIPRDHPLASVNDEFNALFIKGNTVGELMLYGKGAGSLPTGSAVLGDVLSIGKSLDVKRSNNRSEKNNNSLELENNGQSQYYIRLEVYDKPGVLGRIAIAFGNNEISLQSVVQRGKGEEIVPLVFITHETSRYKLDKVLKDIQEYSFVNEIATILKVENL